MTQYIDTAVFDYGLLYLVRSDLRLVILSSEPTTYESVEAKTIGVRASPVVGGPISAGSGRKVTLSEITDGAITVAGTATHWALLHDAVERILCWGNLAAPVVFDENDVFALPPLDITFPGLT